MEDTGTVMQQVHMVSTGRDNVCMVVLVVVVLPVEWMAVFDAEVFTVALVIQTNDGCMTVRSLSQTIQWLQNYEVSPKLSNDSKITKEWSAWGPQSQKESESACFC
jgi:hypothetical protein